MIATYDDGSGQTPGANLQADLTALFGSDDPSKIQRITRMFAMLSRPALESDLVFEAAPNQTLVPREIVTYDYWGEPPCPSEQQVCGNSGDGGGAGQNGSSENGGGGAAGEGADTGGCACATHRGDHERPAIPFAGGLAAMLLLRRRKKGVDGPRREPPRTLSKTLASRVDPE